MPVHLRMQNRKGSGNSIDGNNIQVSFDRDQAKATTPSLLRLTPAPNDPQAAALESASSQHALARFEPRPRLSAFGLLLVAFLWTLFIVFVLTLGLFAMENHRQYKIQLQEQKIAIMEATRSYDRDQCGRAQNTISTWYHGCETLRKEMLRVPGSGITHYSVAIEQLDNFSVIPQQYVSMFGSVARNYSLMWVMPGIGKWLWNGACGLGAFTNWIPAFSGGVVSAVKWAVSAVWNMRQ